MDTDEDSVAEFRVSEASNVPLDDIDLDTAAENEWELLGERLSVVVLDGDDRGVFVSVGFAVIDWDGERDRSLLSVVEVDDDAERLSEASRVAVACDIVRLADSSFVKDP